LKTGTANGLVGLPQHHPVSAHTSMMGSLPHFACYNKFRTSGVTHFYLVTPLNSEYIGWSDVTYLWSQCDRHFV